MKFIRYLLLLPAVIILYLLVAIICSLIPVNNQAETPAMGIPIYLATNGLHTDFYLPTVTEHIDWKDFVKNESFKIPYERPAFIGFGWGDRGFYLETPTWRDLTFKNAFKAIFLPSETLMHVTYLNGIPQQSQRVKKLILSPQQYRDLVTYIQKGFVQKDYPYNHLAESAYGNKDTFYLGTGRFHLFRTCNVWVNRGLKEIGVKTALWTPFDKGILWHLE